jgi:lipoate-protein ligase A
MIEIRDYSLPDRSLLAAGVERERREIWEPPVTCIVLGFAGDAERALLLERVVADRVPVMRRPSGGEAVLLTPRMLALSLAMPARTLRAPARVFAELRAAIIEALAGLGLGGLSAEGASDIAIAGRKVFGSAIYQGSGLLFFHGILNLAEPAESFERYLRHPAREPAWRAGRRHRDFVTSLAAAGFRDGAAPVRDALASLCSRRAAPQ